MKLLRVGEVAERVKMGRSTVYALIHQGVIPSVRIGTAVRVPEELLDAWLREQVRTPQMQGEAK